MHEESDLLWNLYQEHCAWERHHEQQRASATNLLIAVAAGVLGVITFDNALDFTDLPLTLFLIVQGLFGAIFVAKHYERFSMHRRRAGKYRAALAESYPRAEVLELRRSADDENEQQFPRLSKLRLHNFWGGVHLIIAGFGLVLGVGILAGWFNRAV